MGSRRGAALLIGVLLAVPVSLVMIWLWLLTTGNVLEKQASNWLPWPVACTTRGCTTTTTWQKQLQARRVFAEAAEQATPPPTQALTTLLRQELVAQASIQTVVTEKDAQRYREDVLKATDEQLVTETTGLSLADYDKYVILPLLRQEALRQERRVESLDELFQLLASERSAFVLPLGLYWDKESAQVVAK